MTEQDKTSEMFPCDFPIKVMGLANEQFEVAVLSIAHKHFPDLAEGAITTHYSKDKKYLSITINVYAQSREQMDKVYRELTSNEHVMMAL